MLNMNPMNNWKNVALHITLYEVIMSRVCVASSNVKSLEHTFSEERRDVIHTYHRNLMKTRSRIKN